MHNYKEYTKLNIGCGLRKKKEFWNIDVLEDVNPDQIVDITMGLPYNNNSFEEVVANYVLEQIRDSDDFIYVMNEIHRVLKPNGVFRFKVPNAEFSEAFRDPMDCRYFTPETFDHFNVKHYRWFAFQYGFKPWYEISVNPIKVTRLSVKMKPYKL